METLALFEGHFPGYIVNLVHYIVLYQGGKDAIDLEGPRRRYFTLLLKAAANHNGLFEGPLEHCIPVHNMSALMEKTYFSVGQIFAASVYREVQPLHW